MDDLPIARLRMIDFDARRDPKTKRYCIHCQRDLSFDRYVRFGRVLCIGGGPIFTLHPDDVHEWQDGMMRIMVQDDFQKHGAEDLGWLPFGTDCARRHGREWTIDENPAGEKPSLLRAGRWRLGTMLITQAPDGLWTTFVDPAQTAGDIIGWRTDTLAEAVVQARTEMPCHMPPETLYAGPGA